MPPGAMLSIWGWRWYLISPWIPLNHWMRGMGGTGGRRRFILSFRGTRQERKKERKEERKKARKGENTEETREEREEERWGERGGGHLYVVAPCLPLVHG